MIPQLVSAILVFLLPFFGVLYLAPLYIRKAVKRGLVARDMYKPGKPFVATNGGLVMLAAAYLGVIAVAFFLKEPLPFLLFYMIVVLYALYGLADDLLGFVKRRGKVLVLFFLALPIALITVDTNISLLFFELEIGRWYGLLFAPLYIMIVANLINMHSGYNGLSLGLSLIIMVFASVKAGLMGNFEQVVLLLPLLGAMTGMMFFNFYPAKLLLGNVGSFLMGGALGAFLVLSEMEFFGGIILIPHIVNFLLWIYWCTIMKRVPHVKFGKLRRDGTIEAPNWLTVKYLVARLFRVNEPMAVLICYGITFVFGLLGLWL